MDCIDFGVTVREAKTAIGDRFRTAALEFCPLPLPCPFCGGRELDTNVAEVPGKAANPAIPHFECTAPHCRAMAPATVWNQRAAGVAPSDGEPLAIPAYLRRGHD